MVANLDRFAGGHDTRHGEVRLGCNHLDLGNVQVMHAEIAIRFQRSVESLDLDRRPNDLKHGSGFHSVFSTYRYRCSRP